MKDFLNGFLSLVKGQGVSWAYEERRIQVRLKCSYRSMYAYQGGRFPGTITDLGEGGLALSSSQCLQAGHIIKVFCPFVDIEGPDHAVEGQVCWSRSLGGLHNAGIKFTSNSPSWITGVLHLLGFSSVQIESKRRWIRAECQLPARVGLVQVQVVNLGVGGALIHSQTALPQGEARIVIGPYLKFAELSLHGLVSGTREDGLQVFEFGELSGTQLKCLGLYFKALLRRSLPKV